MPRVDEFGEPIVLDQYNEPRIEADQTNGGVKPYMYNKIRVLLNTIQRKHGFPARAHYSVGFYGFVMFGIPDYTVIWRKRTAEEWKSTAGWRWRKVWIYDIPDEDVITAMQLIPLTIDDAVVMRTMRTATLREHPIFENILMLGGLNDIVIDANWDKIKKRLNEHGY